MALALSGLASGIDTDSIIAQLMAVEQQSKTKLQLADLRAQSRQDTLTTVSTKLAALRDATAALRSTTTWLPTQALTSTDATRVGVRALGTSAPGDHVLQVASIAVAAQHAYAFDPASAPGTLQIGAFSLAVDAGSDAAAVADALNARADAPVNAVVAGGSLVLTAKATGAAGDFSVQAGALLAEQPAYARAGADAAYTLDGVARTSASNVVAGAVLGVELTLKAPTSGPVVVSVSAPAPDATAIKTKAKAVVDAYNAVGDLLRAKLAETRVKAPTTSAEATRGLFAGDTMFTGALSSMRSALGDLADLGISTGATTGTGAFSKDAVAGKLIFDDAKLAAALTASPDAVRAKLSGDGGFADRLGAVVAPLAGDQVSARQTSMSADRKRLADALTRMDTRLAGKEKALKARFAAMETALAASQGALSQLQSQLGSLAG